jgi:hypothetical protein
LVRKGKTEAQTPPQTIERLLGAAGEDLVLVGGQALAFWARWYRVANPDPALPAITNDVDFLTLSAADKDSVRRFADVIKGQVLFPRQRALTALVGQAYREISEQEYLNVDVIFKVIGLKAADVRKRAKKIAPQDGAAFLVMHPLDVLYSRAINLYELADKQNDKGRMQLALGIAVARAFLQDAAKQATPAETAAGRSPIQSYVSAIERMAIQDAGRKVAKRYDLHVADAVDPHLIPAGPFWTKRWPALSKLMSPGYRATIRPPP